MPMIALMSEVSKPKPNTIFESYFEYPLEYAQCNPPAFIEQKANKKPNDNLGVNDDETDVATISLPSTISVNCNMSELLNKPRMKRRNVSPAIERMRFM
jgi:hypothetical protein